MSRAMRTFSDILDRKVEDSTQTRLTQERGIMVGTWSHVEEERGGKCRRGKGGLVEPWESNSNKGQ